MSSKTSTFSAIIVALSSTPPYTTSARGGRDGGGGGKAGGGGGGGNGGGGGGTIPFHGIIDPSELINEDLHKAMDALSLIIALMVLVSAVCMIIIMSSRQYYRHAFSYFIRFGCVTDCMACWSYVIARSNLFIFIADSWATNLHFCNTMIFFAQWFHLMTSWVVVGLVIDTYQAINRPRKPNSKSRAVLTIIIIIILAIMLLMPMIGSMNERSINMCERGFPGIPFHYRIAMSPIIAIVVASFIMVPLMIRSVVLIRRGVLPEPDAGVGVTIGVDGAGTADGTGTVDDAGAVYVDKNIITGHAISVAKDNAANDNADRKQTTIDGDLKKNDKNINANDDTDKKKNGVNDGSQGENGKGSTTAADGDTKKDKKAEGDADADSQEWEEEERDVEVVIPKRSVFVSLMSMCAITLALSTPLALIQMVGFGKAVATYADEKFVSYHSNPFIMVTAVIALCSYAKFYMFVALNRRFRETCVKVFLRRPDTPEFLAEIDSEKTVIKKIFPKEYL